MDYHIETEKLARQPYVAIRSTVRMDAIGEAMGRLYGELYGWLGQRRMEPLGPAFARYLVVGSEEFEMELAAPVAVESDATGHVFAGVLPACEVARTLHVGPYDAAVNAYLAIARWINEAGAVSAGAMWEVYLNDPMSEPDPQKWETMVYAPISRP